MNILWDMRLFSFGYANRGVGTHTRLMVDAIASKGLDATLFVYGQESRIPDSIRKLQFTLIPYTPGNWKSDLFAMDRIVRKHHIDLLHYWIALGPLHGMGMGLGLSRSCKTCAVVHDCGVEDWSDDDPFLRSVRASWFWRVQKILIKRIDKIVCVSNASRQSLDALVPSVASRTSVIYVPYPSQLKNMLSTRREKICIALGGSPRKNLARTIEAFSSIVRRHGSPQLVICGELSEDEEAMLEPLPPFIKRAGMDEFGDLLARASALLFCSRHEGLGIPPLQAMATGCPLVLSDIPSLRETCHNAALFANPDDTAEIARAIDSSLESPQTGVERSMRGYKRYCDLSADAAEQWFELYRGVNAP